MTRKGGGVLQDRGVGDYRWTDRPGLDSTIHCDILTCSILASLYMFTNRVLRTSVSFTEDCLVALVDPVVVEILKYMEGIFLYHDGWKSLIFGAV